MENSTKTSDVLNRAGDLIEERGWQRGNEGMLVTTDKPLCLEGAIAAASGITEHAAYHVTGEPIYEYLAVEACPAHAAVVAYLGRRPYVWNDSTAKSAAEVIEVLRAAALVESAKESELAEVTV